MKLLLILLLCTSGCFAQYRSEYDNSERLTGLYSLTEPANCGLMTFSGFVKSLKHRKARVWFSVLTQKAVRDVELDLSELANVDRSNLFHFILQKGWEVEVSGYACGSNGVIDPVSIASLSSLPQ